MELSFEFFPPRTAKQQGQLNGVRAQLSALEPSFYSVTFGAGGSTIEATSQTVLSIQDDQGPAAVPHISCMGGSREQIERLLKNYREAGINRLVALRGDRPSGSVGKPTLANANDLVAFIREKFNDDFHIDVACYPEFHPEARGASADIDFFKKKVEAGANGAITQYFYNADAYFRFVDACRARGINIDIVPGIMPITNYRQLASFSERCGAEIPRWLGLRLQDFGDDLAGLRTFGAEMVGEMCRKLLAGGAPGLHVYTLNRANAVKALCAQIQ